MTHTPMTGAIDVFCVGDSTTAGAVSSGPAPDDAYRAALSTALLADVGGPIPGGVTFNWVGPFSHGSPPSDHCQGISGNTTEDCFFNLLTGAPFVTGAQVIVIIQIGVNNPSHSAEFPNSYLSVVRRAHNLLRAKSPRFVLGLLESAWSPGTISPLNAQLPDLWLELTREGVEFETMSWDWLPANGGNAHPTQAQYNLLGSGDVAGQCYHNAVRAVMGYPM